jgi:hypothetical protein
MSFLELTAATSRSDQLGPKLPNNLHIPSLRLAYAPTRILDLSEKTMQDLTMLFFTALFFTAAFLYVKACQKLR